MDVLRVTCRQCGKGYLSSTPWCPYCALVAHQRKMLQHLANGQARICGQVNQERPGMK
jgi:hypothetical protein